MDNNLANTEENRSSGNVVLLKIPWTAKRTNIEVRKKLDSQDH